MTRQKAHKNIGSYLPHFVIKTCTEAASVHASVHHYDSGDNDDDDDGDGEEEEEGRGDEGYFLHNFHHLVFSSPPYHNHDIE